MNTPPEPIDAEKSPGPLDKQIAAKLRGEPLSLFLSELSQGGGQLALMLLLLELVTEWPDVWLRADIWVLIAVAVGQSAWLARLAALDIAPRWWSRLLGVAMYALVECALEGVAFFTAPHHLSFVLLSAVYAVGMHMEQGRPEDQGLGWGTVLSRLAQAIGPVLYYIALDLHGEPWSSGVVGFFDTPSHVFLFVLAMAQATALVALSWVGRRQRGVIQQLVHLLQQLSSWGYGDQVVGRVLRMGGTEQAKRLERAVAFMDVRGFTPWSESHPPEQVVEMLNGFYDAVLSSCSEPPIKAKLSGDEVLLVLPAGPEAVNQVRACLLSARDALAPYGLNAGAGLWQGSVVEGFLGTHQQQIHDVIGDTVNTARRLCSQAGAGQLLLGSDLLEASASGLDAVHERISVRGKSVPLNVARCEIR